MKVKSWKLRWQGKKTLRWKQNVKMLADFANIHHNILSYNYSTSSIIRLLLNTTFSKRGMDNPKRPVKQNYAFGHYAQEKKLR